jgi:hypothetical protein
MLTAQTGAKAMEKLRGTSGGKGPFQKQRKKEADLDGKGKMGENHNEFPNLNASLGTVQGFLSKQDGLDDYKTEGSYGRASGRRD